MDRNKARKKRRKLSDHLPLLEIKEKISVNEKKMRFSNDKGKLYK